MEKSNGTIKFRLRWLRATDGKIYRPQGGMGMLVLSSYVSGGKENDREE